MADAKKKAALSALDRIFDDATASPLGDRLGERKPSLIITIGGGAPEHRKPDDDDDEDEMG